MRDHATLEAFKVESTGSQQAALRKTLERSRRCVRRRKQQVLDISYPSTLPVSAALDDIRASIHSHQITIVCSGTGSGKSTQIPKCCLDMGYGIRGQIGHTQPRRIAARSVAARIASELNVPVGSAVGSQVRFDKKFDDDTRLKVMTDGVLLEEIRHDKNLLQYDVLIIDEVHERSCNIDFLLGYLMRILPARPELKIILMSATADTDRLAAHLNGNVIDVPGKRFPVELRHQAFDDDELSVVEAIDGALRELAPKDDVLVFLPGEREINDSIRYLQSRGFSNTTFIPLYGRLSKHEQAKVFDSTPLRRVILATNVAETSITIPGVRHVIDTGTARIAVYNPRSKLLELPVAEISQAAAQQRAGRCGREAPGICVRLYSEENFLAREPYTRPEILRTSLASAILRAASLNLGDLRDFPLPDRPSEKLIKDGINLLKEIAAIEANLRVKPLGRLLARLPVDPRLGRFLLASCDVNQFEHAVTVVAAISVGDCRIRPADQRETADAKHAEFSHSDSDLMFYTNLISSLNGKFDSLSRRKQREFCRQNFLSYTRVMQWLDLRKQLIRQSKALKLNTVTAEFAYKAFHTAFLVGFASLVGVRKTDGNYLGAHGVTFKVHPRSSLVRRKPLFIACMERFETSARFADVVAKIDSKWLLKAAPHLIKHHDAEPSWDQKRGKVFAYRTYRLFGIELKCHKWIPYTNIDRARSRRVFIELALRSCQIDEVPGFLEYNRRQFALFVDLENKLRRQLTPSAQEVDDFYERRLPTGIATTKDLLNSLDSATDLDSRLRYQFDLSERALFDRAAARYPDKITAEDYRFPVSYLFDPASEADGMTVTVERPMLERLSDHAFESLCPGLLEEKLTAIVKTLPKAQRKLIAPLAEFVTLVVGESVGESVQAALANCFRRKAGEALPADFVFDAQLPTHLIAHVCVIDVNELTNNRDGTGPVLSVGRFYSELAAAKKAENIRVTSTAAEAEGTVLTRWQLEDLPLIRQRQVGENALKDYQAFADRGDGVVIQRFPSEQVALITHRHGVARLAAIERGVKSRKRALPGFEGRDILLICAVLGISATDLAQCRKAAYAAVLKDIELPRTMKAYDAFIMSRGPEAEALAVELSLGLADALQSA
ncbi:MAG: ATP-dependent RNA helicase HrpA, partial [Pseudomonadota bacterium]